jgi:hypothetical protein
MVKEAGLGREAADSLRELGILLNYNAYGEKLEDLLVPPAALYRELHQFADPFDFIRQGPSFALLREAFRSDMKLLDGLQPEQKTDHAQIFLLPAQPWARRISGIAANTLAQRDAGRSVALLTEKSDGSYVVSVRSAKPDEKPAHVFCGGFPSGGGRKGAGGINSLPADGLKDFAARFAAYF